eukprot:6478720-Amphidinium_carterae.1
MGQAAQIFASASAPVTSTVPCNAHAELLPKPPLPSTICFFIGSSLALWRLDVGKFITLPTYIQDAAAFKAWQHWQQSLNLPLKLQQYLHALLRAGLTENENK